ncbi:uncharacterized protein Bfra_004243 [Botrytis fragariae]|uniref:DUF6590 domain-containing protein n=1 Tax=Botrytis fragariae TaxID=1964551 RepID=A0A8H6AV98_9HELO|nr:uncharacterized protein Bfra_004243 [Botrytis fragariae]KAF5874236.1 hypothetical protein Bfra_004243 [Botrytis fragariae]
MSSRYSHRQRRVPRGSSSSLWSEWEWDIEENQWQSHRTNSRGAIEWQFESQLPSSSSAVAHIPRLGVISPLDTVSEDRSQYSSNQGYITSNNNIGVVTDSLAPATLGPRSNPDPPIVARLQQNNTSTQHRNFDHRYKTVGNSNLARHDIDSFRYLEACINLSRSSKFFGLSQPEAQLAAAAEQFGRAGRCMAKRYMPKPIMSYEGRATSKPGVHPEEHAIIYTTPEPKLVNNEDGSRMIFDPVKMIPESSRHTLDKASRINYAKIYTVEYNVKVWFIGHVDQACEQIVKKSYNDANQPFPLSSQPSVPAAYPMNNPPYDNSSHAMPGTSSNTAGYSSAASYSSTPGYGTGYGTGYGSGYGAVSASPNLYSSSEDSASNFAQPPYSQSQYPPQYPPSQNSTFQHQPYTTSPSQEYNYDPRDTYEPGSDGGQQ